MAVSYAYDTADDTVLSGAGKLLSVHLTAAGADATCVIYDNTAASGTIVHTLKALTNTSASFTPRRKLTVSTGIYVDLTGAGATVTTVYES